MSLSGPDGLVSLFQSLTDMHKVHTGTHQREVIGPSSEPVAFQYVLRKHYYVFIFLDLFYF